MLSGDLGYVKQSVYARLKLNECTEVSHTSYLTCNYVAYCVLLSSVSPRICLRELHGKGNLLTVDVFDESCYLIANLEDLLRVLDSAPGHLGDVE